MTNFEKNITESAREYSLSSDEKARMKRVITEYARHKPLPAGRQGSAEYVYASYSWISILYRPVAAALVLVLVTGSGVSYAAETALPGDILYGVKTIVNEPVRVALATDAEAKAEVQIELAERRIEEATILAVEGRLDETTEAELVTAFESYAVAVSESIAEADEEDSTASIELASSFENRLAAHEMVLAEVAFELDDQAEAEAAPRAHRLADAIRVTNATLAEARIEQSPVVMANNADDTALMTTDATASTEAEPAAMMSLEIETEPAELVMDARGAKMPEPEPLPAPDARTIARMEGAAERSLKKAERTLKNARSLTKAAEARAEADIELAASFLDDGREFLEADTDAEAFAAFQESQRVSQRASVFIKAAPSLEKARSRNSRNQQSDDRDSQNGVDDAASDVSLPSKSRPASDDTSSHDADDRGTDDPDHDAYDDHGGVRDESDEDNDLIKTNLKLDLSL